MHRFLAGTCRMALSIAPQGPWMVRGQVEQENFTNQRGQAGQRDVLRPLLDAQRRPVLPASSLKGVLRSTAERILRSMQPDRPRTLAPLADDPFVHRQGRSKEGYAQWLQSQPRGAIADSELVEWGEQSGGLAEALAPEHIYRLLSPASQLFGATTHAGLLRLDDARAAGPRTQRRSHVALDRFTGGVGEGPFIEELVSQEATLHTILTIENFALWHIGLLALAFQELNLGFVGIGAGTRKGQGHVRVEVPNVELRYSPTVYNVPAGAISAQARLRDAPWNAQDVPDATYAVERGVVLLRDLAPRPAGGWRERGAAVLCAEGAQAHELLRATVAQAWRPWVEHVTKEATA